MLSTGENFDNLSDAVKAANAFDEGVRLYIFGEVDVTESLTTNENVEVWIVPDTVFNYSENCEFIAEGKLNNYSSDENKTTKIILNYWDGRSEVMEVENGTLIDSLPALANDQCGSDGWFRDSEHTQPFEPFVAGENGNYYAFYADTHHSFNNRGRCTKCGELQNGKDAFIRASASVSDKVTVNVTASLSPEAAADKNAVAEFRFSDDMIYTKKMSEAVKNSDGTYTFSCSISPVYIDDEFTLQIRYSDGTTGSELSYSARKYLNTLRSLNILDSNSARFIDTLINYAERLKEYTGKTVEAENNITLSDNVALGSEYKAVSRRSGNILKASFASMSISEDLSLTVKFNLEEGKFIKDYSFTVDGKPVLATQEGNIASITLDHISPDMYGKMHTFRAESVSDASVYAEVDYSPFTYAKSVIEKSSDEKLVRTIKALVLYGIAADILK